MNAEFDPKTVLIHLRSGARITVVVRSYPTVVKEWMDARADDNAFYVTGWELNEVLGFEHPGDPLDVHVIAADVSAIVVLR